MTTKLESIRTAVSSHFAAKEAYSNVMIISLGRRVTPSEREAIEAYNPYKESTMCLLRDLIPLLDAAVAWNDIEANYVQVKTLMFHVEKLLEDTDKLADVTVPPAQEAEAIPAYHSDLLVCHCKKFEGEGWECLRCGGGRF